MDEKERFKQLEASIAYLQMEVESLRGGMSILLELIGGIEEDLFSLNKQTPEPVSNVIQFPISKTIH
jgi:hypothetical protein